MSTPTPPGPAPTTVPGAGSYEPGARLEIERGGWDAEAASGWGPGAYAGDGYHVVQRAHASPHPLTWVSARHPTREAAYAEQVRLEMADAVTAGRHPGATISAVVHAAFDRHQAAGHPGSLADEGDAGCLAAAFDEALSDPEPDAHTATAVAVLRTHFPAYATPRS